MAKVRIARRSRASEIESRVRLARVRSAVVALVTLANGCDRYAGARERRRA
jgi:hypothetical protein